MVISHNLQAMNANRQFNITGKKNAKTTEKLSSGYRINRSADDAAGLAISEKMRRQIRGLTQASFNCQDGISMVQIADGALNEIHDMLHRGTELSVKAANGTLTQEDREYIQAELDQLLEELDGIKERTTFNGIPLLKGGSGIGNYSIDPTSGVALMGKDLPDFVQGKVLEDGYMSEVYTNEGKSYPAGTIDFTSVTADNVNDLVGAGFNIDCSTCSHKYTFSFTDADSSSKTQSGENYIYLISVKGITSGSELVDRIVSFADGGVPGDHFTTLENQSGKLLMHENRDWPGEENLEYYQRQSKVLQGIAYERSTVDMLGAYDLSIQAGAEAGQHIDIKLPNLDRSLMGLGYVNVMSQGGLTSSTVTHFNEATGERTSETVEYQSSNGADMAIESFKNALSYISGERARMGAYQNRLEHTIHNLDNVVENTTAAESAIRDTDMAKEMVDFSNAQILAQTGQSILAQANQSKQGILSVLG